MLFHEEKWQSALREKAARINVILDNRTLNAFSVFAELLTKWNRIYNLTAIDTPEKILHHHFLDSLSITHFISGSHILDIGSGAGFPGIPLALLLPSTHFVLLDSNNKKTRFLHHVVMSLALANVTVVQQRYEDFHSSHCFDTMVTRATASLATIVAGTQHLLCAQGQWLFMKGKRPSEELEELQAYLSQNFMHGFSVDVERLSIPDLDAERHLVRVLCRGGVLPPSDLVPIA